MESNYWEKDWIKKKKNLIRRFLNLFVSTGLKGIMTSLRICSFLRDYVNWPMRNTRYAYKLVVSSWME